MNKIRNFFEDVLKLPYAKAHEEQIRDLIIDYEFKYEWQPHGTQGHPDFYIWLEDGTKVSIECKSNKGHAPMYNSGIPKRDSVYIFCSKKYDETTIFFGRDILSEKKRSLYDLLLLDLNSELDKHTSNPEWKDNRGFTFKIRPVYQQQGGAKYTDYFSHEDREKCEKNVLCYEFSKTT